MVNNFPRVRPRLPGLRLFGVAAMLCAAGHALAASPATATAAPKTEVVSDPQAVGARRMVMIDGFTLHYQDMGSASGETLILLHGAGGIRSTGQIGPLLAKHYHVLIPSMPGFDDTPRRNAQTLAQVVEVLAHFIATVGKKPAYVVGQSLGGRAASWLTITHPELVHKLVLSAPATLAKSPPQLPAEDIAAKRFLAKMLLGTEDAAEQITSGQLAQQRSMMALLADYMKDPDREMFLKRLGEISVPTLLLWGSHDTLLQPDEGPALFAERIKELQVQYLDGSHGLPLTNSRDYVEHTLAFLDGSPPTRVSGPGAPFTLLSSAFEDGGMMAKKYAGSAPGRDTCDGENISPPLNWVNAPAGTRSFALIMFDPTGRAGLGVTHWVAYGIPSDRHVIGSGEANSPAGFKTGKNIALVPMYIGPCPPFGDHAHHYVFTLISTDLPPESLAAGLTREELLAALGSHALAATSLVGRYGH
jgi:Raf kinase inhibitor-like YbhB/YbcL family protein